MHFHYMAYMAMPKHKNPCPRGHKMYNFGKPLFGNYHPLYTQFVWSMPMSGEEKFSVFTQKFSFLGVGVITKNHNALSIKMCHYMDKWHLRDVTVVEYIYNALRGYRLNKICERITSLMCFILLLEFIIIVIRSL